MRSVTLSYRRVVQDAIIYIDPDNPVNLQNQIRQKIVDGDPGHGLRHLDIALQFGKHG